jgi:uncharacterized protein YoaH (UPF0181 family)
VQLSVEDRVSELLEEGMSTKAAAKLVSGEMNVSRKDVYAAALRIQNKSNDSVDERVSTSEVLDS